MISPRARAAVVAAALLLSMLLVTPAIAQTTTPQACAAYTGKPGVTRTFCGGPAEATVLVTGKTTIFSGGSCMRGPMGFTINIGVVTSPGFTGARPDYLGMTLLGKTSGTFTGATISIVKDGKADIVTHASGTVDPAGGHFVGKSMHGAGAVQGSFTCRAGTRRDAALALMVSPSSRDNLVKQIALVG